jgi:hypothetical protein
MDFHWRVAINIFLEPTPWDDTGVTFFENVSPVYLPIGWVDRYGAITPTQASVFKGKVYLARDIMLGVRWGGVALASAAFLCMIVASIVAYRRHNAVKHAEEANEALYYEDMYRSLMVPLASTSTSTSAGDWVGTSARVQVNAADSMLPQQFSLQ